MKFFLGIDVMTSIRRIGSLRRLVLVTTLAKQSVRSILELTRPATGNLGNPFIPIRACVVDTLPAGPHFEAVILMERRVMEKIIPSLDLRPKNQFPSPTAKTQGNITIKAEEKLYPQKFEPVKPPVKTPTFKRNFATVNKNNLENPQENRKLIKRSHSPEIIEEIPAKQPKTPITFNSKSETAKLKFGQKQKSWDDPTTKRSFDDLPTKPKHVDDLPSRVKPWETSPMKRNPWEEAPSKKKPWEDQPAIENPWEEPSQRHKPWEKPPQAKTWETQTKPQWKEDSPNLRLNPLHEKKSRETQDLRERLSANRAESAGRSDSAQGFVQKVKEQHRLISNTKEKLNTPSAPLNEDTAKQLENMLDKVLEQTTKIHNQVSVWDRIAPAPENPNKSGMSDGNTSDGYIFDDRGLLDRKPRKFRPPSPTTSGTKKYSNIPPLEPNLVMPADFAPSSAAAGSSKFSKKKYRGQYRQHLLEKMNKMKAELAQKRQKVYSERSDSPYNRSMSPSISSTGKISPKRSVSPTRSISPRRRDIFRVSPGRYSPGRPSSSGRHSPIRLSPGRHSPIRLSPGRNSPSRHSRSFYSPHSSHHGSLKRSISPKRSYSPVTRTISPTRREVRRVHSPPRHHSPRHSPLRRHSPRKVSPYSRVSPRKGSPRYMSPSPRVLSPRRGLSPVLSRHSPPRRVKTPPRAITPPSR